MEHAGRPGAGRFQWSAGGWFGGQLGATIWLLLMGVVMMDRSSVVAGAAVVALGLVVNGFGVWLWRGRASREPYPAIQMLIAAAGVAALVATLLARAVGDDSAPPLALLLIFPALMGLFHLQEQASRKPSGSSAPDGGGPDSERGGASDRTG